MHHEVPHKLNHLPPPQDRISRHSSDLISKRPRSSHSSRPLLTPMGTPTPPHSLTSTLGRSAWTSSSATPWIRGHQQRDQDKLCPYYPNRKRDRNSRHSRRGIRQISSRTSSPLLPRAMGLVPPEQIPQRQESRLGSGVDRSFQDNSDLQPLVPPRGHLQISTIGSSRPTSVPTLTPVRAATLVQVELQQIYPQPPNHKHRHRHDHKFKHSHKHKFRHKAAIQRCTTRPRRSTSLPRISQV